MNLKKGNMPDFCRHFSSIRLSDQKGNDAILFVLCDYLAIGTNDDYVRIPLSGYAAQLIAEAWDCFLPTQKVVVETFAQANRKLQCHPFTVQRAPWFWGQSQKANECLWLHDQILQGIIPCEKNKTFDSAKLGFDPNLSDGAFTHHGACSVANPHPFLLVSGHKKEVIISHEQCTTKGKNNKLSFWGLFDHGKAVQGYFDARHYPSYADYSHGVRLVARKLWVLRAGASRSEEKDYDAVLRDPDLCSLLIDNERPFSRADPNESLPGWSPYNGPKIGYVVPPSPWEASP